MSFIPRVNSEVLISYINGNIDRPIIIGSANYNDRSMRVDSEIAVITADFELASQSRQALWKLHSGMDGGKCTQENMSAAYEKWKDQMTKNLNKSRKEGEILDFHLTKFYYDKYSPFRTD